MAGHELKDVLNGFGCWLDDRRGRCGHGLSWKMDGCLWWKLSVYPVTIAPTCSSGDVIASDREVADMSEEDLKAELERLKAENEKLKTQRSRSVSLKVSEKGGVSVYGLGRFPVTLYKEQWAKLLDMAEEIRAFIKAHDSELKAKPQ